MANFPLTKQRRLAIVQWKAMAAFVVLLIGFAAGWLLFSARNDSIDPLMRISTQQRMTVGYIPYFEFSSREAATGEMRGFLVDLAYALAEDLGLSRKQVEFVETDWAYFAGDLDRGRFDISIAGTFNTPERAKIVDFTHPLGYLGNGALVRTDEKRFSDLASINQPDVTIAVVVGEQGWEYAKSHLLKARQIPFTGADLSQPCLAVVDGRADVALTDQYILRRFSMAHPNTRDLLTGAPVNVLPISWAVKKGKKRWLDQINRFILQLERSGKLAGLRAKYPIIPWAAKPVDPTQTILNSFCGRVNSRLAQQSLCSVERILP